MHVKMLSLGRNVACRYRHRLIPSSGHGLLPSNVVSGKDIEDQQRATMITSATGGQSRYRLRQVDPVSSSSTRLPHVSNRYVTRRLFSSSTTLDLTGSFLVSFYKILFLLALDFVSLEKKVILVQDRPI